MLSAENSEPHKTGQESAYLEKTSPTASAILSLFCARGRSVLSPFRSHQRLEHFIPQSCSCLQPRVVYTLIENAAPGLCQLGRMWLVLPLFACPFVSNRPNGLS